MVWLISFHFEMSLQENTENTAASNSNSMTLPIRLIRSFEHRNIRHIALRSIDSSGEMTGRELKQRILTSS